MRRRKEGDVYIYSCNYIYAHNIVMKEEQKLVTWTHCMTLAQVPIYDL